VLLVLTTIYSIIMHIREGRAEAFKKQAEAERRDTAVYSTLDEDEKRGNDSD